MILAVCLFLAAPSRHYVLAIGNNAPPQQEALSPLRFADDDAAAVWEFANSFADQSTLLSVLDADTQARFPQAAAVALPPTLEQLKRTVGAIAADLRTRTDETDVWIFFSGHGSVNANGQAALALADGGLSQQVLYDEVLAKIPARYIHLFVDACHAESVVRPRGNTTQITEDDARAFASQSLARFPNVGAFVATSIDQRVHEWSTYRQGVFTYQLLSGLRGSADVNGDGNIEYSELHAFLFAANRQVADERAKVQVVVRPPPLFLRVPLVSQTDFKRVGFLEGVADKLGHFFLENTRGVRVLDAHIEPGYAVRLALPAGEALFLRTQDREARVMLLPGKRIDIKDLRPAASTVAHRGALANALEQGLFEAPFGPTYYRGFVDRSGETSVTFQTSTGQLPPLQVDGTKRQLATGFFIGAGLTGASAVVFTALALTAMAEYNRTDFQRTSIESAGRYQGFGIAALTTGGLALVSAAIGLGLHFAGASF